MGERKSWNKLDNVAKIFPPSTTTRNTNVFRFICQLVDTVDKDALDRALELTLADFPLYRSVLKKGLFWYYFEETDIIAQAQEESIPVCSPLYDPDKPGLLFRVLYYGHRINLEVYHALSDGSGAIQFFRTLIYYYLADKYKLDEKLSDYDATHEQKATDAFRKYFDKSGKVTKTDRRRAYRIRGTRFVNNNTSVIEGFMPLKAVLAKAREREATLSEFLIAHLICAIGGNPSARLSKKPVIITVPVDLRQFFPSKTACNFFALLRIRHHFKKDGSTFEQVLESVRRSLREQLNHEHLSGMINRYSSIENNLLIRAVPLFIKIPLMALSSYHVRGADTASLSNNGKISLPEEADKYIQLISVCINPKRPQICLCSHRDTLSIGFTSPFVETDVQQRFFRSLSDIGIEVSVVSNLEQKWSVSQGEPERSAPQAATSRRASRNVRR